MHRREELQSKTKDNQADAFIKEFSLTVFSKINSYIVILTVVDDTLTLIFSSAATSVPVFITACIWNHRDQNVDGENTKIMPFQWAHHHVKINLKQIIPVQTAHSIRDKKIQTEVIVKEHHMEFFSRQNFRAQLFIKIIGGHFLALVHSQLVMLTMVGYMLPVSITTTAMNVPVSRTAWK